MKRYLILVLLLIGLSDCAPWASEIKSRTCDGDILIGVAVDSSGKTKPTLMCFE